MNTGGLIRQARKNKGLSQTELGKKLGISQALIAQYENGVRNPKLQTLERIAAALEVPVSDLKENTKKEKVTLDSEKIARIIWEVAKMTGNGLSMELPDLTETNRIIYIYDNILNDKGKNELSTFTDFLLSKQENINPDVEQSEIDELLNKKTEER